MKRGMKLVTESALYSTAKGKHWFLKMVLSSSQELSEFEMTL